MNAETDQLNHLIVDMRPAYAAGLRATHGAAATKLVETQSAQ